MAEFDGLDSLVRDALGHAAAQGDSTGVADAIRSRVASGDAGASVAGSTAPGWGVSPRGWLPWVGLIVVGAVVGSVIGITGIAGAPTTNLSVYTTNASVPAAATTYFCPGGPAIGALHGGDRVVAVQRSDDTGFLGVRDPLDTSSVIWVDASVVVVDAGQPAVSTLPIGACPQVAIAYPQPAPVVTEAPPVVTQAPPPPPAKDTTPPTIGQATVAVPCADAVVTVSASDNVGVSSVSLTWTVGSNSGGGAMTKSGPTTWTYDYDSYANGTGNVKFDMTAYDAAGNSASTSVSKNVNCVF
ncbi:MAG: hypothetical protein ABI435_02565 [Pseudolysinimonas sp.]